MLKPLAYSLLIAMSLSACSLSRQALQTEVSSVRSNEQKQPIRFLENISVNPSIEEVTSAATSLPALQGLKEKRELTVNPFNPGLYILNNIENSNWLQFKYSILMKVAVEDLQNLRLLHFIDEWYATRYKFGGSSKKGIDCSAFTSSLLSEVFSANLPRTCREQYHATERIRRSELREGDLVFFSIRKGISHVGVYLTNNKFVHASSSNGVMISDLEEDYFSRRYAGAGRVINNVTASGSDFNVLHGKLPRG